MRRLLLIAAAVMMVSTIEASARFEPFVGEIETFPYNFCPAGYLRADGGEIRVNGEPVQISSPRDAKRCGIETIYQTLALADNVDAAANIFLGREKLTAWGTLDDHAMEAEARKVMGRLNPHFRRFKEPVKALSGGQRQSVAIARAIHFDARVLIMDEPTAALGPAETRQVGELVRQFAHARDQRVQARQQIAGDAILQHQGVRDVVDVLGGAAEVDELADAHDFGIAGELFLEPVFHRLDVMIGARFDGLDGFGVGDRELRDQRIQFGDGGRRERRAFGDGGRGGERLEPFDFDLDAIFDQAVFGKMVAQGFDLGGVAAIEGRQRGEGVECHGKPVEGSGMRAAGAAKGKNFNMAVWRAFPDPCRFAVSAGRAGASCYSPVASKQTPKRGTTL